MSKPVNGPHQCSDAIEALLKSIGVTITMGGEPTFIPHNPEGAEWATAALGPTKLDHARRCAHALIQRDRPGAVILETSGKHYPGEPLPRWTLLLQTRADGTPLWKDPTRLKADDEEGPHTLDDANAFLKALVPLLGLGKHATLPLLSADEPPAPAGHVLPLDHEEGKWLTDDWAADFPEGHVPLFQGDGLAGLRMPLNKLAEGRRKRALTVELSRGTLAVFVPPLLTDAYCELLGHIEAALADCKLFAVRLSGYAPPADPALPTIGFASDPGVLEINLTPEPDWTGFDRQLHTLYAAAGDAGLCARKFQLNGRHVGTGGGCHMVFGGPTPETSPFFTTPHLLPSVIRYFQHHPGLSYAFSGQYLGPSSQAPRIDESTFEAPYELELACRGAVRLGSPANLPLFDLLFRDLLMDRSGNTHRAEISVDKLWNPFAGNGRLGLVEFRAFETHPDPRLQGIPALLLRAILARLAAEPFEKPFRRWGHALHDKYFLPAFIKEDLDAVCADLRAHGIPFDSAWLAPLIDWRCPVLGELELPAWDPEAPAPRLVVRQALEAWPLLGESPNGGGVSRTVDASMDRIEFSLTDASALEHGLLLVNGIPVEFRATEDGASAAGVRYRAFYICPGLQPHVPAHAPLLIEWVGRHTLCVLAAARWHVWNPAGTPYADRPATADEARVRAAERWETWPHTIGHARYIPAVESIEEMPATLDLRLHPYQSRG
ncbi:MAG: transglutaminase family protein [Verrucomicrobiota bacterium]